MNIYVFTSSSLTNIWAGIGARTAAQAGMSGAATKATNLRIGSLGLLYCSETQVVTTPFVVTSKPDTAATVDDVWADVWHFPFHIEPLGSPRRVLHKDALAVHLPSVATLARQWHNILHIAPNFAFQPSEISEADWEYLYSNLNHS